VLALSDFSSSPLERLSPLLSWLWPGLIAPAILAPIADIWRENERVDRPESLESLDLERDSWLEGNVGTKSVIVVVGKCHENKSWSLWVFWVRWRLEDVSSGLWVLGMEAESKTAGGRTAIGIKPRPDGYDSLSFVNRWPWPSCPISCVITWPPSRHNPLSLPWLDPPPIHLCLGLAEDELIYASRWIFVLSSTYIPFVVVFSRAMKTSLLFLQYPYICVHIYLLALCWHAEIVFIRLPSTGAQTAASESLPQ
jgi:hypothetical protein